jgi:hypothetical protein
MVTAYICMMSNITNNKDHRNPEVVQKKWQKDMLDLTNFIAIWFVIIVLMQIYKAYLKSVWGIE